MGSRALQVCAGISAIVLSTGAAAPPDTVEGHLAAAKQAAQFDFLGTLGRLCVLPQTGPGEDRPPGPPPPRASWYAEPGRAFDNLYFVGGSVHSAWALVTSDGIILLDTIFPYNSQELIVGGMRKLGLDPARVKYVIITHGHADHVGGAKLMQDRFGARIVMSAPDWDYVENSVYRYGQGPSSVKPKRDIVGTDGQKITLGDTTVTLISTPGHTPGTLSMAFQVKDNGRPVNVVYSGGTAFNFVNTVANFQTYIDSQRKMMRIARETGATAVLSNHSEFDQAVTKTLVLRGRRANEPNPFEVGAEAVQRYFKVSEECARVAQIKLEQK